MTVELRDGGGKFWALAGLASTYRQPYFVGRRGEDTFREIIEPGAFLNATNPRSHVELRVEHDPDGPVLASTTGKTLGFDESDRGLLTAGALAKSNPHAQVAFERYQAGELRSFSVGMRVMEDDWPQPNERHVIVAHLDEVSLCGRPCNPGAVVTDLRAEVRSGTPPIEYRMVPLGEYRAEARPRHVGVADEDGAPCPQCQGTGHAANGRNCTRCNGTGRVPIYMDLPTEQKRRQFSDADRTELAKQGKALPDGSFPIVNAEDLRNAIAAIGRAKDPAAAKRHIRKRAAALGLSKLIPASWGDSRDQRYERDVLDRIAEQRLIEEAMR